jgi:hypothetical protein
VASNRHWPLIDSCSIGLLRVARNPPEQHINQMDFSIKWFPRPAFLDIYIHDKSDFETSYKSLPGIQDSSEELGLVSKVVAKFNVSFRQGCVN